MCIPFFLMIFTYRVIIVYFLVNYNSVTIFFTKNDFLDEQLVLLYIFRFLSIQKIPFVRNGIFLWEDWQKLA